MTTISNDFCSFTYFNHIINTFSRVICLPSVNVWARVCVCPICILPSSARFAAIMIHHHRHRPTPPFACSIGATLTKTTNKYYFSSISLMISPQMSYNQSAGRSVGRSSHIRLYVCVYVTHFVVIVANINIHVWSMAHGQAYQFPTISKQTKQSISEQSCRENK